MLNFDNLLPLYISTVKTYVKCILSRCNLCSLLHARLEKDLTESGPLLYEKFLKNVLNILPQIELVLYITINEKKEIIKLRKYKMIIYYINTINSDQNAY